MVYIPTFPPFPLTTSSPICFGCGRGARVCVPQVSGEEEAEEAEEAAEAGVPVGEEVGPPVAAQPPPPHPPPKVFLYSNGHPWQAPDWKPRCAHAPVFASGGFLV
jgi:hypothetical protein